MSGLHWKYNDKKSCVGLNTSVKKKQKKIDPEMTKTIQN